ncbi:hypothetical protein [Candidatus Bodocaedibacter vickermanii]|uniref:Uncharacterized protein n=1 Tax=Candidatus Bodocaedibacter vickermanii TaxID=2741701 RepID=A0A7L9RTH2_9PROT|nr:hypothetical protein CPBP_00432 [Candidatus Paracaedibacteraceae bacterium 'Lake Konstanz']
MRIQRLLLIFLISFVENTCDAKNPSADVLTIKRSFTLTPGYMERTFNSNEMMKHGPLSLMQLYSKGTDVLCDISNDPLTRLGIWGLCLFPNYYIADTSHTVYHEFGHARAIASMGLSYEYSASAKEEIPTDYAYGIYLKRIENPSTFNSGAATQTFLPDNMLKKIPSLFLKRVMTPQKRLSQTITQKLNTWWNNPDVINAKSLSSHEKLVLSLFTEAHKSPSDSPIPIRSVYTSEAETSKIIDKLLNSTPKAFNSEHKESADFKKYILQNLLSEEAYLVVSFAGINNQMRYAQDVSNLIFKYNGHLMYSFDYFFGKYEGYRYVSTYESHLAAGKISSGDDIYCILRNYDNRDYTIDAFDIKMGSLASLFLSATTWSFVYSAITELPKGSFLVHAPVWNGWRLPDLNFYMTSQGLSFEVVTGYQFNDRWHVGLTAEMVYKGNTAYEFGPSITYKFSTPSGEFELSAQAIISNDLEFGGAAGIEWTAPRKDWAVGVKYTHHNALTFAGERNIPFFCAGLNSVGKPSHTNDEASLTLSYNY